MRISKVRRECLVTAAVAIASYVALSVLTIQEGQAQVSPTADALRTLALKSTNSLKTVKVADAPTFKRFVVDRQALQQLGKALFWDQQVGSDGQACASCHFHAGADNRSKNQINPGFRNATIPGGDTLFGSGPIGALMANYQLTLDDFPFHKLLNPNDRNSFAVADTNDVVSSQGVFNAAFTGLSAPGDPGWPNDLGMPVTTGVFRDTGAMVRNVEPRNTPTTINAVLNHRNFWDGRGRSEFNGVNPLGSLETGKIVKIVNAIPVFVQTRISKSSGASQAVGPPLSGLEMSFAGRRFPLLGRKMLNSNVTPLKQQYVDPTESVLGSLSAGASKGITVKYADLIKKAFTSTWWDAAPGWVVDVSSGNPALVNLAANQVPNTNQFTVMEYNFSLFLGMAINEYEKLLIANDSRFDRFMEGNLAALNAQEQRGLEVFLGQGKCSNCHGGPELTNASLSRVRGFEVLERMIMGNDRVAVYDNGFYNTGVRPTGEDLGVGATIGSKDRPLSNSRAFQKCVNDSMTANPALSVAQANANCGVPRILARPTEAAILLAKAAAQVGNLTVTDLLNQANAYLTAIPPDLVQGSCKLAKNPALPCAIITNPDGTLAQADGALDVLATLSADPSLLAAAASLLPDPSSPGTAPNLLSPPLGRNERVAVDGAFKTPSVRNAELTAPYFHNGGTATLRQMVDFYNRGGDFAAQNQDNLDIDIQPLGLTEPDKDALVAFLVALTDERVKYEKAPFDHPSLNVPNGGSVRTDYDFGTGVAAIFGTGVAAIMDDRVMLPAVGAGGCASVTPPCENGLGMGNTPYANFLQSLTP